MDNVTFTTDTKKFQYRVAGLCVHDGYALLHRAEPDEHWLLPGGRCHIGEPSNLAIERELHEELGVAVQTERLLWFVENFFADQERPGQVHEIACYYLFGLPTGSPLLAKDKDHIGIEGDDLMLTFRWFPIAALPALRIYPTFLRTEIANLPAVPIHLIHYDDDEATEA